MKNERVQMQRLRAETVHKESKSQGVVCPAAITSKNTPTHSSALREEYRDNRKINPESSSVGFLTNDL